MLTSWLCSHGQTLYKYGQYQYLFFKLAKPSPKHTVIMILI